MTRVIEKCPTQDNTKYLMRLLSDRGVAVGVYRIIDRPAPEAVGLIPLDARHLEIIDLTVPHELKRYLICRNEDETRNARRAGMREVDAPAMGRRVHIFEES